MPRYAVVCEGSYDGADTHVFEVQDVDTQRLIDAVELMDCYDAFEPWFYIIGVFDGDYHSLHEVECGRDVAGESLRLARLSSDEFLAVAERLARKHKRAGDWSRLSRKMTSIIERYGGNDPARCSAIRTNFERCRLIEMKIFHKLDLEPGVLGLRLGEDAGGPELMRS